MGEVVPFKKPLGITTSFHEGGPEALGVLAEEIYRQCQIHAITEAFKAKRQNPDIDLNRLVPSLTELFAQEVIADKVYRAGVENNLAKLHLAEEIEAVMIAQKNRCLRP